MEDIDSVQAEVTYDETANVGGLEEVHPSDPVIKSTNFGDLDNTHDDHDDDLFVKVEDPEKHIEGYVSYYVLTKTTRSEFDEPHYSVRRRYQDFLWLRHRLEESYPTHVIPPLPEKNSFTKHFDRFSEEYMKIRQDALNRFVCRVASHPVLSFRTDDSKKQSPGRISRIGDSVKNAASSMMLKTRDQEFIDILEFAKTFYEKIGSLEKITDKIARERFDLLESYRDCIPVFRLWSNSEIKLGDSLNEIADAMEKNNEALKSLLKLQDASIMEPLKEYILYIDSIKGALKRRDAKQMEYEVTVEELKRKKKEKEELEKSTQSRSFGVLIGSRDPEEVKKEKIDKLNLTIQDLEQSVEAANDKAECANHDLKADIERWHKNKRHDFKKLFTSYSEHLIEFFKQNYEAWSEALKKLETTSLEDNNKE